MEDVRDFTNLKNVCPKDSYPMSNIDTLVDNILGCGLLNFMILFLDTIKLRCPLDEETNIYG